MAAARQTALIALVLAFGLLLLAQPAAAQYGYSYGYGGSYGRRLLSEDDLSTDAAPLFTQGRSLLQYGYSYGYGGSYGRRLLSTGPFLPPFATRPRRSLLQYGGSYGYGYYG